MIAPEVMCRQNHGVAVDYFAAGVMAFECMFGRVTIITIILIFISIRDPTLVKPGKRFETTSCPNRSRLSEMKYPEVGL
jgi:hypothetical protein